MSALVCSSVRPEKGQGDDSRRHGELTRSYSSRRRESRQGSMRSRRIITPIIACLVAVSAALPAAASAGSLLSGYGGPGQGSQAILGSALLNGPAGRGAGGGARPGLGATAAALTCGGAAAPASRRSAHTWRNRHRGSSAGGQGPGGVSQRVPGSVARSRAASDDAGTLRQGPPLHALGARRADLHGLLTRRLARTTAAGRHGS